MLVHHSAPSLAEKPMGAAGAAEGPRDRRMVGDPARHGRQPAPGRQGEPAHPLLSWGTFQGVLSGPGVLRAKVSAQRVWSVGWGPGTRCPVPWAGAVGIRPG